MDLGDQMVQASDRVGVLFVAGYTRSGSTLLDRLLGEVPGFCSTGELAYLLGQGLRENRLCGCGARFWECPFWQEVGRQAFGGWETIDVSAMIALDRRVNRHRYILFLIWPRLSSRFRRDLQRYAQWLGSVYRAIQTVSGAEIIIDSSQDPAYAFVLRHVGAIDLHVIHFVRDSRGTAYSGTKRVRMRDSVDKLAYLPQYRPSITAARWLIYHLLVHLLEWTGSLELLLRYEDTIRRPREAVQRSIDWLGISVSSKDLAFLHDGHADLPASHTLAGNRMRWVVGRVPLQVDDEWMDRMSPAARRLVTAVTWPLLSRYGYPALAELRGRDP